jgi:hypothetical protein
MLKETPHNVARLAMTLSNQIGVKELDLKAMRDIYSLMLEAMEFVREPEFAKGLSVPMPYDMDTTEWQTFAGMGLMAILARRKGGMPTVQQTTNMCRHMTVAVETLLKNEDMADQVARSVLGSMYPTVKGLPDGHHKTK